MFSSLIAAPQMKKTHRKINKGKAKMLKRIPKWLRIVLIIAVVLAVIAAVLPLVLPRPDTTGGTTTVNSKYQTVTLQRSSLVATISITGAVRSKQSANLTWTVSARVGELKTATGQQVKKGDVLAVLDLTSLPQNLIQAQNDLINAQNNLKNLNDQAAVNKATAEKNLTQAQKDLEDAQTKRGQYSGKTRADDLTIKKAEADYTLALDRVKQAQEAFDNVSSLDSDSTIRAQAQSSLASAQSAARQSKWMLDYYRARPSATDINQVEAVLQLAKVKVDDAQRQYDLVKNGPAEKDITIANNNITMAQANINQTRLTAPFSGTITNLNAKTGDVVAPGSLALRIDDLSSLYIDSQVSEVDINRIQIGQAVSITFDAISNKTYEGKVVEVGTAGSTTSGAVNFPVTIQITNPDGQVKTAMTAGVTITIEKLDNVLVVPVRAIRTVSGKRVVFVPDGQSLKPVIVELGSTAESMVEIAGGDLKEGDTIITNPPAQTTTFGGPGGGGPQGASGGN
jgi:HlyD family secretion protein